MSRETDKSPGMEGYWEEIDGARREGDDAVDAVETETVRERLTDRLDGDLLRVAVTAKRGTTVYLVVSRLVEQHGRETVDLRTVVLDGDDLRVTDNGLWVPADETVGEELIQTAADATGAVRNRDLPHTLTTGSAVDDVDGDLVLDREIAPDESPEAIHGWGVEWGNGNGPPAAVDELVDRLREAGVETDRFSRLTYGGKEPHERSGGRAADGLLGNYGVETLADDPLIVIDVDDPDAAPLDALPATYAVSSPHGDDRRAHHYLRVDDADAVEQAAGSGAVKPGWGDVWLRGEYVVGPGSLLTSCDKDECDVCGSRGGRYDVVADREIAEVSAEWLIDLLDLGDDAEDPDPVDADPGGRDREDGDDAVECADCGAEIDPDDADLVDRDGAAYVCGGGCHE